MCGDVLKLERTERSNILQCSYDFNLIQRTATAGGITDTAGTYVSINAGGAATMTAVGAAAVTGGTTATITATAGLAKLTGANATVTGAATQIIGTTSIALV